MGKPTGFKEFNRELPKTRKVEERLKDWDEVIDLEKFPVEKVRNQAARCMDCGIPFCHSKCPLGNIIPQFNDLVYKDQWRTAYNVLSLTNNFPEFTGRVCPAPCEEACVLNVHNQPVTIKLIEESIIEYAFAQKWVKPEVPKVRTGKKVAVVGSGPSGLACAAQLNKAGHLVTVFERADRVGGLFTYGIPNFKLDKDIVERRVELLKQEGITFRTDSNVGFNIKIEDLRKEFDAICFACGATQGRELDVEGRELQGIYLAMDYLRQQNKVNLGDEVKNPVSAKGKRVVVLGGGDTGADCLGTALRQGALSVHQFELLPCPPPSRTIDMPWPLWPMILRNSSSHEEGGVRDWSINTKKFSGENGSVRKLHAVRLEWLKDERGRTAMKEIEGSEFIIECDLVLLALGFVHPEHKGAIEQLKLNLDARGNVLTDAHYQTALPGIFACGDMHRGQSLVVWAISEGRKAAQAIDLFLMGTSDI